MQGTQAWAIREATAGDSAAIGAIAQATELFPAEFLPDMIAPFLAGGADIWLVAEADGAVTGFAFLEQERLTDGTWNMLALAVSPDAQGQGIGAGLTRAAETVLRQRSGRVLLVDTAGTDDFAGTRAFYVRQAFRQEACLPDYYADGIDKVTFWKRL